MERESSWIFDLKDVCRELYSRGVFYTFSCGSSRSRIDKICVSSKFVVEAYFQEDTCFSDHNLIVAKVTYNSIFKRGKGVWRNNVKFYSDEAFRLEIEGFWNRCLCNLRARQNLQKSWGNFKQEFRYFFVKYSKEKAVQEKREKQFQEQGLYNIIALMNRDPKNTQLRNEYISLKKTMVRDKIKLVKEKVFHEKAMYLMHGDKPTKSFFDKFKSKKDINHILSLINQSGIEVFEIHEILHVAANYFQELFSGRPVQQSVIDLFLRGISPKSVCQRLMNNLIRLITLDEVRDAIFSLKNGRAPGPDGISIEFYKAMFAIIGEDLRDLFNSYMRNGRMAAKIKTGIIKLIPKQAPYNMIDNYRPISLINCDYKIFTKIISTRLQPILKELIHESQFAQPGMDFNRMNTLIRDLIDDMGVSAEDSFLVSVDFKKAFDTVSHEFLFKVLEKYGFPNVFINIVKELYRDAGSHLLINGHKSKKIKLKSGIRQGDPFSRDVFVLVLNPLLVFLNNHALIEKYRTLSRQSYLTLAYMDDANFLTQSLSSLLYAFFYVKKYGKASGLEINMTKTNGLFVNKRNVFRISELPNITWKNCIRILKINYGPKDWVNSKWNEILDELKNWLKYYGSTAFTFKAKANITKNKLLPMISYVASVHPLPKKFRESVDSLLVKFIVPFFPVGKHSANEIESRLSSFAAPNFLGGINTDHITLHSDLLMLKPVMQYVKALEDKVPLPSHLFFLEYNIGFQLCGLLNFPRNNRTPHANVPNFVYCHILEMVKWLKISREELLEGSVNKIYKRIIFKANERVYAGLNPQRIMAKYLPSYLQTFNYKLNHNLLPVKTMFREYALDNDSVCYFCNVGPESIMHLFGSCEKLRFLWQFMSKVHFSLTTQHFDFEHARKNFKIDLSSVPCVKTYEKTLVYFCSVTNYTLWRIRNDIRYKFETFDEWVVIKKIIRSVGARKNMEHKLAESFKVPFLTDLYNSIVFVSRLYPFDNG